MLTIEFSNFLFYFEFFKTKTTLSRVLYIGIAAELIAHLMIPYIFVYFDILVLSQLFHLDLKRKAIERVSE